MLYTFQIVIKATSNPSTTTFPQNFTASVTEGFTTPSITAPTIAPATFQIDDAAFYSFKRFICSNGCTINEYWIVSDKSTVPSLPTSSSVAELGTVMIPDYKFAVDTTAERQIDFYIFSRLLDYPQYYAFTNMATISVICGSETISMAKTSHSYPAIKYSNVNTQVQD
jgi:hypothetical protein